MKVRNLLLAGLAVAAMTACSNNEIDEIVDNGKVDAKEAFMEFGIAFPTLTRANGTEVGLASENDFQSATIILDYGSEGKEIRVLDRALFTETTENVLYTKEKVIVKEGTALVYVVLNPTNTIASALAGVNWNNSEYTANYGDKTTLKTAIADITGNESFLMSGAAVNSSNQPELFNFVAGKPVTVRATVDRVAAKFEEKTDPEAEYDVTKSANGEAMQDAEGNAITVKVSVTDYTYANLQKKSYVFNKESNPNPKGDTYQPWGSDTYSFYPALGVNANGIGDITYCLENYDDDDKTMAIYKAEATINGVAQTFWVDADNKLYKTISELNAVYSNVDEDTSIEDCQILGIRKYVGGVCYYKANIKTDGKDKIVRNNVYKLTVTNIEKLGLPEPKDEPEMAELKLEVEVKAWTIQTNNFEFK